MVQRGKFVLSWVLTATLLLTFVLALTASSTQAAVPRGMTGSLGTTNPSVAPPGFFERGPHMLGTSAGPYPQNAGPVLVSVTGTGATGTSLGRGVALPANRFNLFGLQYRNFPAFPNVAQVSFDYSTHNSQATFVAGGGPLASCPGDGCTAAGAGTAISWCPPAAYASANPAPGTTAAKVGDWDCLDYGGAAAGALPVRLHIEPQPGGLKFGGTFRAVRNSRGDTWRISVLPSTPSASDAVATRSLMINQRPWPGGAGNGKGNFGYQTNPATPLATLAATTGGHGPKVRARIGSLGAVTATFGCAAPHTPNGTDPGTVGHPFVPGSPAGVVGSNCGTAPGRAQPGQEWGFEMTTGFLSGSDFFPGTRGTSAAGTPFAPVFVPNNPTNPFSPPFFFTRQGGDQVVGTGSTAARNIVLLGGGVGSDPESGNLFFRIMDLRMNLTPVPEPSLVLGLLAGIVGIGYAARRRRLR